MNPLQIQLLQGPENRLKSGTRNASKWIERRVQREEVTPVRQAAMKLAEIEKLPEGQREITLLELVAAVSEVAQSDAEVVAAVSNLINTRKIRLVGNFRGADVTVS